MLDFYRDMVERGILGFAYITHFSTTKKHLMFSASEIYDYVATCHRFYIDFSWRFIQFSFFFFFLCSFELIATCDNNNIQIPNRPIIIWRLSNIVS